MVRQAFILTLALLPVAFALWAAAPGLIAAPATWLAGNSLTAAFPEFIAGSSLSGPVLVIETVFGEVQGSLLSATKAGNVITVDIDTRTLSYGLPFYSALFWGFNKGDALARFVAGIACLWCICAFGIAATAGLYLVQAFPPGLLAQAGVPPADGIALAYQFSTLLAPTLAPVVIWLVQLRWTSYWPALERRFQRL